MNIQTKLNKKRTETLMCQRREHVGSKQREHTDNKKT